MKHLSGAPLELVLDLFANIILGLKGLPGTNTPGACTIKLLRPQFTDFHNKLECLSLASLSSLV